MKQNLMKLLQGKKKNIMELWMQNQIKNEVLRDDLMTNDELRAESEELIAAILKDVNESNVDNPFSSDFEHVEEILGGISISRARQGFTPRETGLFILSLKNAFLQILQNEIKNDPVALHKESTRINLLMDSFTVTTFETFLKGREDIIMRQSDEISEISTPVIRVWDGILALPIIGTLDSSRTQVVMESLLTEIVETGSNIAILDISGVPAVDSLVAQHLIKTVSATRLMGAECIISGIRPEIAQTIVHLGIDLSEITTKASLAAALRHSFALLKLEVRKSQTK